VLLHRLRRPVQRLEHGDTGQLVASSRDLHVEKPEYGKKQRRQDQACYGADQQEFVLVAKAIHQGYRRKDQELHMESQKEARLQDIDAAGLDSGAKCRVLPSCMPKVIYLPQER
jgi:hypothetical protein